MKKYLVFIVVSLLVLCAIGISEYVRFNDHAFHLIFCDVGQGDGILMRTPTGKIIIVDGGPDEKILGCLSRHTPFWERTITLMLLSHPHADHLNGLIPVLDRYVTRYFVSEELGNKTTGYNVLTSMLASKHISKRNALLGDSMMLSDGVSLKIISPTRKLIAETSPNGIIGESKEFANLITLVTYKDFHALLVGDSQAPQVEAAAAYVSFHLDIMQVPHHGSMTGLSEKVLELLMPKLAVISVGKNKYGHPTNFTLGLLKHAHIPTHETMKEGDIEIVTSGKGFALR